MLLNAIKSRLTAIDFDDGVKKNDEIFAEVSAKI